MIRWPLVRRAELAAAVERIRVLEQRVEEIVEAHNGLVAIIDEQVEPAGALQLEEADPLEAGHHRFVERLRAGR